jgi:hypothetical protein
MKNLVMRSLIVMIVMLSLMMVLAFFACDNGNGDNNKEGNSYNGKTVDQKFWGDWRGFNAMEIKITKTEVKYGRNNKGYPAWSEGNTLFEYDSGLDRVSEMTLSDDEQSLSYEDGIGWTSIVTLMK